MVGEVRWLLVVQSSERAWTSMNEVEAEQARDGDCQSQIMVNTNRTNLNSDFSLALPSSLYCCALDLTFFIHRSTQLCYLVIIPPESHNSLRLKEIRCDAHGRLKFSTRQLRPCRFYSLGGRKCNARRKPSSNIGDGNQYSHCYLSTDSS